MNIAENNKKIAEFMGERFTDDAKALKEPFYDLGVNLGIVKLEKMRFNSSWDWLMGAVEKIERNGKHTLNGVYDNRNEFKGWYPEIFTLFPKDEIKDLTDLRFDTKIEAVYKAVIAFIDWHNENFK